MKVADFVKILGGDEMIRAQLEPHWAKLTADWNGKLPDFVSLELFKRHEEELNLPAHGDLERRLQEVHDLAKRTPELALFFHIYYQAYLKQTPPINLPPISIIPLLDDNTGAAYFFLALGTVPGIFANAQRHGIPERYAANALRWIGGAVKIYQQAHDGIPGFTLSQLPWLRYHHEGRLYRIGRFEYLLHNAPAWLPVIYRQDNGDLAVLCRPGTRLNPQGLRLNANAPDSAASLITTLVESRGKIAGTPISPDGYARLDQRLTLDLQRWHPVCTPWDLVPSVHIPGGEPLILADALDSFREAQDFFRRFMQREVPLFCCASWILNPAIEQVRPNSNLAKFQRELYLTPGYEGSGRDGLFFVAGNDDPTLLTAPSANHGLQMLQEIYRQCGTLRVGGMFVLTDQLNQLGQQFYRNRKFIPNSAQK